jgi:hypothetical protein
MLESAADEISATPYGLGSDLVRTPSTVNALPGSRPGRHWHPNYDHSRPPGFQRTEPLLGLPFTGLNRPDFTRSFAFPRRGARCY